MKILLISFIFGIAWASDINSDFMKVDGVKYDCAYCQPEQIHIAFGEITNDIVVTWSTFNDTEESIVEYGEGIMDQQATGTDVLFTDGGPLHKYQWIHRVTLKDLKFNTTYVYHVGSKYGWSTQYSFKTPPAGEDWVVRAAIFGDMGNTNAHSLPYLQEEAERGHMDMILHVGDFAYDMNNEDGAVGDRFMRQVEPLAASVPYMTCPGNHEEAYNFSNYRYRFSMPNNERTESLYYSWDIGPIHFVAIDTELYYFLRYGVHLVAEQFEWLQADLEKANQPENRRKRPWIIVYGHRPMYCSNSGDDCWNQYLPNRVGLPVLGFGLEPLLKQYGVDIVIWAHEHSYERTWPLYDRHVYNGSLQEPYTNPKAPVHIITGSAGCKEGVDGFHKPKWWSAFRSSDYGYTRFKAFNKTHIFIDQMSVEDGLQVIDSVWIIKNIHKPFDNLP